MTTTNHEIIFELFVTSAAMFSYKPQYHLIDDEPEEAADDGVLQVQGPEEDHVTVPIPDINPTVQRPNGTPLYDQQAPAMEVADEPHY